MTAQEATSIPIRCRFGALTVVATGVDSEASVSILNADEAFSVRTSVEFLDTSAVALLALEPLLHLEFYAKPCGPEASILLGETRISTTPDQGSYSPSLSLRSPADIGLSAGGVYRLGALLRVGAEAGPALICAVQEDVLVQIISPEPAPSKNGKKKAGKTSKI